MSTTKAKTRRHLQVLLTLLGIALGIASIIAGIKVGDIAAEAKFYPSGAYGVGNLTHLGQSKFGADFYTEIYEATAFTGNVLKAVFDILAFAIPAAFELGGAAIILRSLRNLAASLPSSVASMAKQGTATTESEMAKSKENGEAPDNSKRQGPNQALS